MYRIFGTFICIQGNGAASCPRSKKWIDCGLIAADFVDGPRDQGESQLVDSRDNLELFLIHAVSQIFQDACFHVGLGKGGVIILADGKKMKASRWAMRIRRLLVWRFTRRLVRQSFRSFAGMERVSWFFSRSSVSVRPSMSSLSASWERRKILAHMSHNRRVQQRPHFDGASA